MKVIELLNKIANGEEVPDKIYYGKQYWVNKYPNDYEGLGYGGCLLNNVCLNNLNDEVEIIKNKKIDKTKNMNTDGKHKNWEFEKLSKEEITLDIQTLKNKVNEIIDYLEEKE